MRGYSTGTEDVDPGDETTVSHQPVRTLQQYVSEEDEEEDGQLQSPMLLYVAPMHVVRPKKTSSHTPAPEQQYSGVDEEYEEPVVHSQLAVSPFK